MLGHETEPPDDAPFAPDEMTSSLLEQDHAALDTLLNKLSAASARGEFFRLLDAFWARLAVHIRAEHLCLFPAVIDAARARSGEGDTTPTPAEVERTVARLREDHDFFMRGLADAVNTTRALLYASDETDANAGLFGVRRTIEDLAARLEEHNALEESGVYEWAYALLDAEARGRLDEDVRRELSNLPSRLKDSRVGDG